VFPTAIRLLGGDFQSPGITFGEVFEAVFEGGLRVGDDELDDVARPAACAGGME